MSVLMLTKTNRRKLMLTQTNRWRVRHEAGKKMRKQGRKHYELVPATKNGVMPKWSVHKRRETNVCLKSRGLNKRKVSEGAVRTGV